MLAPLAAFAATPLGMGILATVTIALVSLAMYAISKNNKISEVKAPKIFNNNKEMGLIVTEEVYEEMKKNNQNKDKDGKALKGEYRINFSSEGKDYYVTGKFGNSDQCFYILGLSINSLGVKNDKGDYDPISDKEKQLEELGLNKEGAKWVNTYLGSLIVEQVAPSKDKTKS